MAEDRLEPMVANRLRQRLVGAAVIIALAVLLLPIWLDGSGLRRPDIQPVPKPPAVSQPKKIDVPRPSPEQMHQLQHPPASILPGKPGQQASTAAPAATAQSAAPASPAKPPLGKAPNQAPAKTPDTPPAPTAQPSQPPAPSAPPHASRPASDSASAAKPQPKSQPQAKSSSQPKSQAQAGGDKSTAAADAQGNWVVQLGSFSDELNAKGLKKSVSQAGFKVYIEPLFAKKGTVWRVRVGPFATREEASKATERLRERLGRDGLVMAR